MTIDWYGFVLILIIFWGYSYTYYISHSYCDWRLSHEVEAFLTLPMKYIQAIKCSVMSLV